MELIILFILLVLYMKLNGNGSPFKTNDLYDIAYELGINYLNIIKKMGIKNPTVMFDIDDTLLYVNPDNSLSPIKSMIRLLNYCINNNFIVLIITARSYSTLASTIKDLEKNKIHYHHLYLRQSPKDDHSLFKANVKRDYTLHGFNIVMSVGDNDIDIIGDYSGYSIKLPNKTDPRLFHINMDSQLENVVP